MKSLKISLVLVLAVCVCLSLFGCKDADNSIVDTEFGGTWSYELNDDDTVTLTSLNKYSETIVVPSTIDGKIISALGQKLFMNIDDGSSKKTNKDVYLENTVVKNVIIEAQVESIPEMCFYYCVALQSVTLPDTLKKIQPFAFFNCKSLENIVIPAKTEFIGEYAFRECLSLTSVTINYNGNDCIEIGDKVFYNLDEKAPKKKQYYIPSTLTIYVNNIEYYQKDRLESTRIETKLKFYGFWEEYAEAGSIKEIKVIK